MYDDLTDQNKELYERNGVLSMLDRNRNIKTCPERFQENFNEFDVIFTCEERGFQKS